MSLSDHIFEAFLWDAGVRGMNVSAGRAHGAKLFVGRFSATKREARKGAEALGRMWCTTSDNMSFFEISLYSVSTHKQEGNVPIDLRAHDWVKRLYIV